MENNFITFRFDFFGSGESPRELRDKDMSILEQNAMDAIDFIANDPNVSSIGLWGRSLGGTFVCLLGSDPRVKASVSASGASLFEKIMVEKFEELKNKEKELERKGKKLPGTGKYKGKFEFKDAWFESLKGLDSRVEENLKKTSHILVLSTTPDIKVPLENACKIINLAKEPKEIHIFEKTEHDYRGVKEEAVELTVNWFKRYLK